MLYSFNSIAVPPEFVLNIKSFNAANIIEYSCLYLFLQTQLPSHTCIAHSFFSYLHHRAHKLEKIMEINSTNRHFNKEFTSVRLLVGQNAKKFFFVVFFLVYGDPVSRIRDLECVFKAEPHSKST